MAAKPMRKGMFSKHVLDRLSKRKRHQKKVSAFNQGVTELVEKRKSLGDPNYGRPELAGRRRLTKTALGKVNPNKLARFEKNLTDYKSGGKKEPEFKGLAGARGRLLSPKALSKVSPRKSRRFSKLKTK